MHESLASARAAFEAGNFPLAMCHVRAGLEFRGQVEPLLELLARTLDAIRLPQAAERARLVHRAIRGEATVRTDTGGRYLVIREWGAGFWSDVDHVLTQLLLAEITNRTPIVHWGSLSRYRSADRPERESAWDVYFTPVSSAVVHDVQTFVDRDQRAVHPARWQDKVLHGPIPDRWSVSGSRSSGVLALAADEPVVVGDFYTSVHELLPFIPERHALFGMPWRVIYRYLIAKYLRPKSEHEQRASAFARLHMQHAPTLAVHVRGTDKATELKGTDQYKRQLMALAGGLDQQRRFSKVCLLTDDQTVVRDWNAALGSRLVLTDAAKVTGDVGLHFKNDHLPETLGTDVLVDTLIALHADCFVGLMSSNMSFMIWMMKDWAEGNVAALGAPMQLGAQAAIHERGFRMQEKR